MSKDRKQTIELPVETVENWARMCEYCSSTIKFLCHLAILSTSKNMAKLTTFA